MAKKSVTKKPASKPSVKKPATKKVAPKKSTGKGAAAKKTVTPKVAVKKVADSKVKTAKEPNIAGKTPSKKTVPTKKPPAPKKTAPSKKTAATKKLPATKPSQPSIVSRTAPRSHSDQKAKKGKGSPVSSKHGIVASPVPRSQGVTRPDRKRPSQVVFTMDDVRAYLREHSKEIAKTSGAAEDAGLKKTRPTVDQTGTGAPARPKQVFGAASIADILGFDPTRQKKKPEEEMAEKDIPNKFLPYYRSLQKMRAELAFGLERHSKETLLRSNREESGDLASFGQHMADASSESYERDFALNQVSSEQDALYEIDEALRRIKDGSYGVCEITGQVIKADRLKAVPFTRYSVEGQMEMEKTRRRSTQRTGLFSGEAEDSILFTPEDFEE